MSNNDLILDIIDSDEEYIDKNFDNKLSYYQQKKMEDIHWYYKYRIDVLKKYLDINIIENKENLNILDIGIGTGTISKYLEQFGNCIHIDNNEDIIKMNLNNLNNVFLGKFPWDLTNIKEISDKKFDYIILFNVLEYCENIYWIFDILKTFLAENGKILISTLMNPEYLGVNEKLYEIKNRFKIDDLFKIFKINGLEVKDYSYFEKIPKNKEIINYLNKFLDEENIYLNTIPLDNEKIYNFYKNKEFEKIGIERINNGKQILIKLMISNDIKMEKQKINVIDKIIDGILLIKENKDSQKE